jgi:apolipoprotein N-acyltransferase
MSANATSLSLSSATSTGRSAVTAARARGTSWGRFALVGIATIVAAVLANTLFYYVGGALVAYDPDFIILATPGGTIFMTFVPAVVAVLLYAALLRFTSHAARIFSIVAAIALVASFVPDFTYVPSVPGSSDPQIAILLVMHVIAAGVIVRMLTAVRTDA